MFFRSGSFLGIKIDMFCLGLALTASAITALPTLAGQPGDSPSDPSVLTTPARSDLWNAGFTLGTGLGDSILGSRQSHDLAIGAVHAGKMAWSEDSTSCPFLHRLEVAGEAWGGAQYNPEPGYVAGLTPFFRYHARPGARWDPFFDAGAGVTLTDIGEPDLSTKFEFNLQAGAGIHWRVAEQMALTVQARYIHLSNAGIDFPNGGVNSFVFSGGLTWFF